MKGALLLAGVALMLSACSGGGSGAPDPGGRPALPTGAEVRFPAAPANAFLSLVAEDGTSPYNVQVAAGATVAEVDPTKLPAKPANTVAVGTLVPAGATEITSTDGAKVLLLKWVMWQDKNNSLTRDPGEELDLMTHDRVAYASVPTKVSFKTATPDMQQTWTLDQGWSRAEHYVYLPRNTTTYKRSLESAALVRYTLHVTTPITSQ